MASVSSISASAPGTLMLLGEHAVLHGRRALACAIDRRITVTLTPRVDRELRMESALGSHRTHLDAIKDVHSFRFVTAVFREREIEVQHGFDIEVRAEFPSTVGLGSSAAVTVACAKALDMHLEGNAGDQVLHQRCLRVVRFVQGAGSGADLAAAIAGGVVAYRVDPYWVESIHAQPPLVLVYSGSKTPTPEVIQIVESNRAQAPEEFDKLFDDMDRSIDKAVPAIRLEDWDTLGRLFGENQRWMKALGVSNSALEDIVSRLCDSPGIHGAKISGSGLGDCVVAIGEPAPEDLPYEAIPVSVCKEGARFE